MSTEMIWETSSTGSAETERLGELLGRYLNGGDAVELVSDLGGGKTTFVKGLAKGIGSTDSVSSPTFTLINQYNPGTRRLLLVHIDTYRLGDPPTSTSVASAAVEAANLGLEEILSDAPLADSHSDGAIVVIEWAERVAELLPTDTLYIHLTPVPSDENARTATLMVASPEVAALLRQFAPNDLGQ